MSPAATYNPPPGLRTALDNFRDYLNQKYNVKLETYHDLHAFSVDRLNDFWLSIWYFTGIKASVHPKKALDESMRIDQVPRFFEDTRMNFAENMLCRREHGVAIIDANEENLNDTDRYTWPELREMVRKHADALRGTGLQKGEVVALIGSNCVRSLALLLAVAAVGGVFSSFATDIGEKALDDRLKLLQPRLLFAESTYLYNGKKIDISRKVSDAFRKLDSSQKHELVVIGTRDRVATECTLFEHVLERGTGLPLTYEQLPFSAPFIIMFSSGTTGAPKGIIHSQGGLVLNGIKEHVLHNNLGPKDMHFHFSGIGWTLWNISIGALFSGSSMVLYDGSPFYPGPEKFLVSLLALGITSFGAGPRYFSELQKSNVRPKVLAITSRLRAILSSGALLTPALATWLEEAFGPVCQMSFAGGTELCGSFLHGTLSLPSYPGQLAVKALGMDIAVFSPEGKELAVGKSGELVCRKPFPNMPVAFLNDPGRKRYHSSCFEQIPHVWTHGDFIQEDPATKGFYVLGRSDGVLNPSGVRFGSSEIYNILSYPKFTSSIRDFLVVGQQRVTERYSDPAERVVLFIKCTPSATTNSLTPTPTLDSEIRLEIAKNLSRRHVPTFIFEVPEVPYNVNGKKLEIQVKRVLCDGREGLVKLKITKEELRHLEWFVKFHDIEKVLGEEGGILAKL